jgi:hypothetical protein
MYSKCGKKLVVLFSDCNNIIFYGRFHSDGTTAPPDSFVYKERIAKEILTILFSLFSATLLYSLVMLSVISQYDTSAHFFLLYDRNKPQYIFRIHQGAHKVVSQGTLALACSISP